MKIICKGQLLGFWRAAGQTRAPICHRIGDTGAGISVLHPMDNPLNLHPPPGDSQPGVQRELSKDPCQVQGKWWHSGDQKPIRMFLATITPSPYSNYCWTILVDEAIASYLLPSLFSSFEYFRRGGNIALSADNLILIWHNMLKTSQKIMACDAMQVKMALWKMRMRM